MWLPWSSSRAPSNSPQANNERSFPEDLRFQQAEQDVVHLGRAWGELTQLSSAGYALLAFGASALLYTGWLAHRKWDPVYSRYFKRIRRHYEVPDSYIKEKRYMKGIVTSVPDGDGFSFLHTPGPGWRWPLKFRRLPYVGPKGSSEVMRMRMAAVDAPEVGKGETEGQPFSAESQKWLESQVLGRTIYCQLLKRESQYGRMIVLPFLPRRFIPWWFTGNRGTNLSEEIIRRGWAFVYESTAGEFPHPEKREGYLTLMAEAQKAKVGMWKHGTSLETPAQYKKRTKQGIPPETTDSDSDENEEEASWFRRSLKRVFRSH
ncbi:SNase-domain-containing protein [Thelephora terrestris]|uniref:SNase-domain-containing protein n=1 Tax=Thelephora terrestris TaxID=56493 RepID=A0A9P6HCR2_9AGAM|nr:SNase-domain-containing protein [Thelephora terrestris]